ncbi:MAG: hypothetical protein AABX03_04805 [Nanoarchaeota archaeon]
MELIELEERIAERKVAVEVELLNRHLQMLGNGANIHRIPSDRSVLIGIDCFLFGNRKEKITFRELSEYHPDQYDRAINVLAKAVELYGWAV